MSVERTKNYLGEGRRLNVEMELRQNTNVFMSNQEESRAELHEFGYVEN